MDVCLHSLKTIVLQSMKCSCQTHQNLLYISCKRKPRYLMFILQFVQLYISLSYQGIYKGESKVAKIEQWKKLNWGFFFTWNIVNFEAFCLMISLSSNFLFLKSVCAVGQGQLIKLICRNPILATVFWFLPSTVFLYWFLYNIVLSRVIYKNRVKYNRHIFEIPAPFILLNK